MEELARDFGKGNCCDIANFRFRVFDRFGTMYGFHVRGKEKFQTKVGSVMTLGWLVLMIGACVYYMQKLLDKTDPVMQTNRYRSDAYPSLDLQDENFHFYWTFRNLKNGGLIPRDFWWENFSMYASMLTILTNGAYKWENIPIVKCETQDWWSYQGHKHLLEVKESYFCLDQPKGLTIYGGGQKQSSRIMIDFYPCMPGGSEPCNIKMTTNNMIISTWAYEKTANIKDYQEPITNLHREISRIIPSAVLRYDRKYWLGWTDIITDTGVWTSDLETKKMITLFQDSASAGEKSLANIPRNYLTQGRLFYSDIDLHMEIMTSNEKVEIYRSYLSIIEVLSAIGG
jgi:hypothetical protein